MSASDDIKTELVEHFDRQGLDTTAKAWKRRSKTRVGDYVVRHFENPQAGLSVLAVTVDEEEDGVESVCIWETGPIGFAILQDDRGSMIRFTPLTHWERTRSWPSLDDYAHPERAIEALPLRYCGDDRGDNMFTIPTARVGEIRGELTASGYTDLSDRA